MAVVRQEQNHTREGMEETWASVSLDHIFDHQVKEMPAVILFNQLLYYNSSVCTNVLYLNWTISGRRISQLCSPTLRSRKEMAREREAGFREKEAY